jgi:hypothetical protein
MIYNPRLNLLFVHIQKTAGTSITQLLLAESGSRHVYPPHLRVDDVRLPRRRPRIVAVVRNPWERQVSWYRMMARKAVHNDFSAYLLAPDGVDAPLARPDVQVAPSANSSSAPTDLPSFSTFIRRTAIVRETQTVKPTLAMRSPLRSVRQKWRAPYLKSIGWNQEDYLTIAGEFVADEVLRFERVQEEWAELGRRLLPGRGWSEPLPHANRAPTDNVTNGSSDWRSYYEDGRDIDFVGQLFARDVARWGFTFDP